MHETLVCENLRNVKLEWFYGLFDIGFVNVLNCLSPPDLNPPSKPLPKPLQAMTMRNLAQVLIGPEKYNYLGMFFFGSEYNVLLIFIIQNSA